MEVHVSHLGNLKFNIRSRSHSILCDQPQENGGEDTGMTPPEFLLASLGSCAAYYAVQYLKARKLSTSGLEVSVNAEKLQQPSRLGNFKIQISYPNILTPDQNEGLSRSVRHCLVHNTLLAVPEIEVSILLSEAPVTAA